MTCMQMHATSMHCGSQLAAVAHRIHSNCNKNFAGPHSLENLYVANRGGLITKVWVQKSRWMDDWSTAHTIAKFLLQQISQIIRRMSKSMPIRIRERER